MKPRLPRLGLCGLALLGLVSCAPASAGDMRAGATPTSPPLPATTVRPTAEAGQRIDLGGYWLFLSCSGAGSPTVILEAGLDGDHTTWDQVQPAAARQTRVCSYDRAGLGQSDPSPHPRTSAQMVVELHALLAAAGVQPPYVLVGHSFGGLHIRRYAYQYPEDVTGLVFVDAVHEDWWSRARDLLPPPGPDESDRVRSLRTYLDQGYRDPAGNREGVDIPATIAEVKETGSFGKRPVVVLTAGVFNVLAPGLPPELEAKLKTLFQDELQGQLAQLSTDSVQIVVPDSGHNLPQEDPAIVVKAIQAVLASGH